MRFLVLGFLLLPFAANASRTVHSKIYDIDYGVGDEETFIMLTSGDVAWVKKSRNKSKQRHLELTKYFGQSKLFILNDANELVKMEEAPLPEVKTLEELTPDSIQEEYTPTVVADLPTAMALFKAGRYLDKDSQCFNRAHVWTYEWFTKNQINSNKTWVFFTRRYIRKFKFEWRFHVSPSVAVRENGVVKEKILDIKYARGPIDLKRWTDIFLRDDAHCPMVTTYSDYANYPESGSCYTMRSSMFYYQPFDLEAKETWGTMRADWIDADVKAAYLEAFDEVIEGITK